MTKRRLTNTKKEIDVVKANESLFIKNGFETASFGPGQDGYARRVNGYEVCATFESDYWLCGVYSDKGEGEAVEVGEFVTAPGLLDWVFLRNKTTGKRAG